LTIKAYKAICEIFNTSNYINNIKHEFLPPGLKRLVGRIKLGIIFIGIPIKRSDNMERQRAIEELRTRMPEYLQEQGVRNLNKNFTCLDPAHQHSSDGEKNRPGMSYDRKTNRVKCFKDGAVYDIFDLIGAIEGIQGFNNQLKRACEKFNYELDEPSYKPTTTLKAKEKTTYEDLTKFFEQSHNLLMNSDKARQAREYLTITRGLTIDTIERFNLGFKDNEFFGGESKHDCIIIPTSKTGYTRRNLTNDGDKVRKKNTASIFNKDALLNDDDYCYVVEGEIDAMSIEQLNYKCVAIGSTAYKNMLIETYKDLNAKCILILALDNDGEGIKAQKELSKMLIDKNIPHMAINDINDLYGICKDANESMLNNCDEFESKLIKYLGTSLNILGEFKEKQEYEAKKTIIEYEKMSDYGHLDDYKTQVKNFIQGIPTGFKLLDNNHALDGGLYAGLYVIGAMSGLGKTTYILQMATQIAKAKQDILYFSLEMSRHELISKTISRIMYMNCCDLSKSTNNAKTARHIMDGNRHYSFNTFEKELYEMSLNDYFTQYAPYIYTVEVEKSINVSQIEEYTKKHYTLTGRQPIVIIDYLQLLAPPVEGLTDKQAMDITIMRLKQISRDYKIPVLVVSSFNRSGYGQKASMASFKESGAIEYSCDVLMSFNYSIEFEQTETTQEKDKIKYKEVILEILKNRYGAGSAIKYKFYSMFNYFVEIEQLTLEEYYNELKEKVQAAIEYKKSLKPQKSTKED